MTIYVISDGNGHFIMRDRSTNKYVRTSGQRNAMTFQTMGKALNVCKSLPKGLSKYYGVVAMENPSEPAPDVPQEKPVPSEDRLEGARVREIVSMMDALLRDLDAERERATGALSLADREVSDIYHDIELKSFNAYQGWLYCKRLQDVLKRRRKIKNTLKAASFVSQRRMTRQDMDGLLESIDGLNNQRYTPRIQTEEESEIV